MSFATHVRSIRRTPNRNLQFHDQLTKNLHTNGEEEKVGKSLANSMSNLENKFLKELSKPDGQRDEGKIQALKIKYERAQRMYAAFNTLMQNAHQLMMNVIRSMRLG